MSTFEYVMIYVMCWWVALFLLLPLRAHRPVQPGAGIYAAAPERSHIKLKLLGCTFLAALMTATVSVLFHSETFMAWLAGS